MESHRAIALPEFYFKLNLWQNLRRSYFFVLILMGL